MSDHIGYHKLISMAMNKVIIIGGGCAGLTAGIYCARAELQPLIFTGQADKGGLLVKTSTVENYPGFPDGILGYDLMVNFETQAVNCGAKIIETEIVSIKETKDTNNKYFILTDSVGEQYRSLTVIVCTGSKPNKLGLDREEELWSRGISSCAVCDGALFKNKSIVVVGGGDTAMEEALFLTKFSNVTLIHRRNEFRASKAMVSKVLANPKIKIVYDTIITSLHGEDRLQSIDCKNIVTGEETNIVVNGLFYGLGLKPNTKMFEGLLELDNDGYILRSKYNDYEYETMTFVEGIFVAGDANDKTYRQAIVASGDGCKAALDVNKYLNIHHI